MKLPFLVKEVGENLRRNWDKRFSVEDNWDRSIRENVWRRYQHFSNSEFSGWKGSEDLRRRILHFRDRYAFENGKLFIKDCYFYFNIKNEAAHVEDYAAAINNSLQEGGWDRISGEVFKRSDLLCRIVRRKKNPNDDFLGVPSPKSYLDLEIVLHSETFTPSSDIKHRPWHLLKVAGIRPHVEEGSPRIVQIEDLLEFLPAQVEIGCGPSIEAQIPALNYLHEVYGICRKDKKFVFEAKDDAFLKFLSSPEESYRLASSMHLACLVAEPNSFYHDLKWLCDAKHVVGPIITNNFDGLTSSLGLDHILMRAFDTTGSYPTIEFHPEARSLIVFGCHADRRTSQWQARRKGLKVIFIDPQGYETEDGFYRWPIESPQNEDYIIEQKAAAAMHRIASLLRK